MQFAWKKVSVILLTLILLTGCSYQGTQGVSSLCAFLGPVQRSYSLEEKTALLALLRGNPVLRKPLEQAAMVNVGHEEYCE